MKNRFKYLAPLFILGIILIASCKKETPKNYYFKYTKGGNTVTLKDTTQFAAGTGNQLYIAASNGLFYFLGQGTNTGTGNFQVGSNPLVSSFLIQFQDFVALPPLSISGTGNISNISDGDITGSFNLQLQSVVDTSLYEPMTVEFYAPYYQ